MSVEFECTQEQKSLTWQKPTVTEKGNRIDKHHCCLYCERFYSKIARHLEQVHHEELEVAKVLMLKKGSKERRQAWLAIVNKGDFNHNHQAMEKGHGLLIPKRRVASKEMPTFIPCEFCLGMYVKCDLWRHQRTCVLKKGSQGGGVSRGKMLLPLPDQSSFFRDVLFGMRDDHIKNIVMKDSLIKTFGQRMHEKHGSEQHRRNEISTKMRDLAKVVQQIQKELPQIKELEQCIDPIHWEALLVAVKKLGQYSEDSHQFGTGSFPVRVGFSLKKCANLLATNALKQADDELAKKADSFLKLYDSDWYDRMASIGHSSLEEKRFNNPQRLPLMKDVATLNQHLEEEVEGAKSYADRAQACLAQIIIFNRKRSGEASRMKLEAYQKAVANKKKHLLTSDASQALTKFELQLCKTHTRVEIKGKRGRNVPILLTNKMEENINRLIDERKEAGINNPYLFGRPGDAKRPYRGHDCLGRFARSSGAQHPELVTSTNLRKQLGTMAQVLNLPEDHQDMLATFLGHDLVVHRKFYRLSEDLLQAAKVSKILHLVNEGTIAKYKGQDFDSITFDGNGELRFLFLALSSK